MTRPPPNRVVVGVTAAALLVLGAAGLLLVREPTGPPPRERSSVSTSQQEVAGDVLRVWPSPGREVTWAVVLRSGQEQSVAGAAIGGSLDVTGHIRVRGLSPADGRARTAWSFARVDQGALEVLDVKADAAELRRLLVGPEIVVTRDEVDLELAAPDGAAPMLVHVVRAIALDAFIDVGPPSSARWSAEERTPRGMEAGQYERSGARVVRTRDRLSSWAAARVAEIPDDAVLLDGVARATLDADGLVELELDETMAVDVDALPPARATADTPSGFVSLSVRRLSVEDASDALATRVTPVSDPSKAAPTDRAALTARAHGLEGDALLSTLRVFAAGGRVPRHNHFFWQATARLRLEPALCGELTDMFEGMPSRGRGLILDLLVAAGTPEAQAAAVSALRSDAGRTDVDAPRLLSRLGFVEAPTDDVLALLADVARGEPTANDGWTRSARLALGGAVGHAAARDQPGWEEGHALLVEQLHAAPDAISRDRALRALGNAGLAHDDARIASFATDDDPRVREAAAMALRKIDTPTAHDTLLELAADSSGEVQQRALLSLDRRALAVSDVRMLEDLASAGQVSPAAATALVDLLQHTLEADADVADADTLAASRDALRALLASAPDVPGLEARLFLLLDEG